MLSSKPLSQRGQRFTFDVIVVGSGIAGLVYSLELLKQRPHTRLALITKGAIGSGNSRFAQGGIATAVSTADIETHIRDTTLAGDGLCCPDSLNSIISQGPDSIHWLQNYGVSFNLASNGQLARGQEAGHTARRICHISDHTGQSIMDSLVQALKTQACCNSTDLTHEKPASSNANITIFEAHTAVNLISTRTTHSPANSTRCIGIYALSEATGLIHTLLAQIVVLATGGAGKVYRYTSNSALATGDGVAMAWRAGARIGGMEFYQFHPTLLYHPQKNHFLISEALRGEGAYLRLPNTGERFMQRYAPDTLELATRDIVSRAIFSEIERGHLDYIALDCRHLPSEFIQQRFPTIHHTLNSIGLSIQHDLIPIVPAAHYMGGGILSDVVGQTDIAGLLAIGETAFTGLHGANRLASNSLLEGVVMGRQAACLSNSILLQSYTHPTDVQDWDSSSAIDLRRASQITAHWRGLRGEMTSYAGIVRTEAGLHDQLKLIKARRRIIEHYYWKHRITRDLIELRNISLVAELIVRCALLRRESRGGHYREDHPEKSSKYYETVLKAGEAKITSFKC